MHSHVRALLVMPRERRLPFLEQLEQCDIQVFPVCTLAEAVHTLGIQSVDVIVTDTRLADGDWTAVLQAAANSASRPQVVTAAGPMESSLCAEAYRRGAYDVLGDSCSREELSRVIEAAAAKTYMTFLGAKGATTLGA